MIIRIISGNLHIQTSWEGNPKVVSICEDLLRQPRPMLVDVSKLLSCFWRADNKVHIRTPVAEAMPKDRSINLHHYFTKLILDQELWVAEGPDLLDIAYHCPWWRLNLKFLNLAAQLEGPVMII